MNRSKGRPIIPIPVHPERVISRAMKAGLSVTLELQRNIKNKTTQKYYDRSRERFQIRQQVYQVTKAQGIPNFSHISMAEAPLRDDMKLMFYERAAEYGFTEIGRQKNTDDTVDPLNQRFNACGSIVRENSEVMFPFPDPEDFGTYSRRSGKTRKRFRRAGYDESSFGPRVMLAHPNLPSLDFGDAIRSHNEYLATFCAIHDVPVRETTRYSQLFFLLVRPYLEYLYSEFKCGKANFQKGVNWALRQVKDLILEAGYRPTIHERKTVTKNLEFEEGDETKRTQENWTFFRRMEDEAKALYGSDSPVVLEMRRLRGELGEGEFKSREKISSLLTVDDVKHIRAKAAKRTRIAGSIVHRRIADLFSSPWQLNDIIISGDRYARSSDYLILSEVPIETEFGAGKVDFLLCERTVSEDGKRIFWKPAFITEIKTRLGLSMYIDADYKESEVRSEDTQRVVSDFPLHDHPLSGERWNEIIQSTPTKMAREQLNIYSQALAKHYASVTDQELGPLLRGVIVIESSGDISEIRSIIERLLIHGYEQMKDRVHTIKRTVFTPSDETSSRIALVIDEQPRPKKTVNEPINVPWNPLYSPFKANVKTKREFLLYLAGHSPSSAGQSAAWNASYYHGLQLLYEMRKKNTEFIWLDLASQFNKPRLAETRLHLRPRSYSETEIAKVHPDYIRGFFENIRVKGFLDEIISFLYDKGDLPSINMKTQKSRRVIIISGADTLRDATPSSYSERFSLLIEHLLSSLPNDEKSTVVWFDSPVPSVEKSIPYSTRALLPYYDTSSLGEMVTEIIWNLPVAPKDAIQPEKWSLPTISETPMHDDIRVIVRHTSNVFHTELIHVPLLRGWSRRFRNKGFGPVVREQDMADLIPEKNIRDRMRLFSLTLLPWLVRLGPHELLTGDSKETTEDQMVQLHERYHGGSDPLSITKTALTRPPGTPPTLLDLVTFRLPATVSALSYQAMTVGKINSQRLYRSPRKLRNKPLQRISEDSITPLKIEEGPEWIFGIKFQSDDEDIRSWWLVTQNPEHPSRMLVGCFTIRPPDKDGFLWAESRHNIVTQSSLDEILGFPQTLMIGRTTNNGMEYWSTVNDDAPMYFGTLELKGYGRRSMGHLRTLRQTLTEEPLDGPSHTTRPSDDFYTRVPEILERYLTTASSPTPVSVHLDMDINKEVCTVIFKNEDQDAIQEISIIYTADLISTLRRSMVGGGPLFTDSGEFVTWNIFDDINYGELDFIKPYVIYTAARKTPEELPKRIAQFFEEAKDLTISVSHDASICPLALGAGVDHDACWKIDLPSRCPSHVRKQFGSPLTGEEVNGLLAPSKFYAAGKLYNLDFILPKISEKDESIVFHEEPYIRMFLRSKGLSLRRLIPGTYLEVETQQWVVSIGWEDSYFKWIAQSLVSGLSFRGDQQQIELTHGRGAEEECKRLVGIITSQIPATQIQEFAGLKKQIRSGLESRGYSIKSSPVCEIKVITQSEKHYEYGIFLIEGFRKKPLNSYRINVDGPMDHDGIIDSITEGVNEGELTVYNIVNLDDFLVELADWVREYVPRPDEEFM